MGRTITIYLNDGSITGIRHAEIDNWSGQAISSPRTQIKSLISWPESQKPGVYFLFGIDETSGNSAVYIGEAENVFDRIQKHVTTKDFWNEVIFFTSKDQNITKSHVKYMESRLIQLAKSSGRYVILNGNEPQLPLLSRGGIDATEEFISNLRLLLGIMGHKVLESLARHEATDSNIEIPITSDKVSDIELILNIKGTQAKAIVSDEGIIVLTGSSVSNEVMDSLSVGYRKFRTNLIENNVITETEGKLTFQKDQLFTSPSQAAAIIMGYSINGRHSWKTKDGVTLKVLEDGDKNI